MVKPVRLPRKALHCTGSPATTTTAKDVYAALYINEKAIPNPNG
ncbi:MAG: hypothetical protein O2921_02870 [Chloroflexi bacterium]|nr:hypothetical protein [Chloroflexota bacterium]